MGGTGVGVGAGVGNGNGPRLGGRVVLIGCWLALVAVGGAWAVELPANVGLGSAETGAGLR